MSNYQNSKVEVIEYNLYDIVAYILNGFPTEQEINLSNFQQPLDEINNNYKYARIIIRYEEEDQRGEIAPLVWNIRHHSNYPEILVVFELNFLIPKVGLFIQKTENGDWVGVYEFFDEILKTEELKSPLILSVSKISELIKGKMKK